MARPESHSAEHVKTRQIEIIAISVVVHHPHATRTGENGCVIRVVSKVVKHIRQCDHAPNTRHSKKEVLVFAEFKLLPISTHCVEGFTPKHRRPMWERDVPRATHYSPPICWPGSLSGSINAITKSSHDNDIRIAFHDIQLPS